MSNVPIITGFDAFGSLRTNPSETLVRRLGDLHQGEVQTEILATSYERASDSIRRLIRAGSPSVLLMFGFSSRARGLRLERLAHNHDSSRAADNDGRTGRPTIVEGAPSSYHTNVDIESLVSAVRDAGGQAEVSDDAGGFVCNHAYFVALDELRSIGSTASCVFVHVPDPDSDAEWSALSRSAQVIIDQVARHAETL